MSRTDITHLLCSAQQLGQQLRSALVAAQCRADTAVTFCCSGGGPRHPWSSGLAPVSSLYFKSSENTKIMAFGTVKASENTKIVAFRTVKSGGNAGGGGGVVWSNLV